MLTSRPPRPTNRPPISRKRTQNAALKPVAHQAAREMVAVTTDDHPQGGPAANAAPATKPVPLKALAAPGIPTPDQAVDQGLTADRKVALAMKMVHHVVDLVARECQVVNVMETLDQAADRGLIGDRKVVLEMKMVHHAGLA